MRETPTGMGRRFFAPVRLLGGLALLALACEPHAKAQGPGDAGVSDAGPLAAAGDLRGPERARRARAALRGETLKVGYAGSPPFVTDDSGSPGGLSIAVWEAAARDLGVRTQYAQRASVRELLEALASGELDVAVGPLSVTAERAGRASFTQPYFSARLGILSRADSSMWERLQPFFNRAFLVGVLTLLLVLGAVGTLVWFVERRHNSDHFPTRPVSGIREGMWFALVTMTTVGYGDRVVVTGAGRLITGVWMVFAMVAASSLTAGIATALTLSQFETGGIASLEDLSHQRVVVVRGTPAEQVAHRHAAKPVVAKSKDEGLSLLARGSAAAMLYDLPILDRYVQEHPAGDLVAYGTAVAADDYAFAVQIGSPLWQPINQAVLRLRERRAIAEIATNWSVQP